MRQGSKCDFLYIEACLVEESKDTWVINSGATNQYLCFFAGIEGNKKSLVKSFTL